MKIFIRTDSSTMIGSGHLMRCLTLAEELREAGVSVNFICRDLPGNLADIVLDRCFQVHYLPRSDQSADDHLEGYARWLGVSWKTDAEQTRNILDTQDCVDWLIVDHYALDVNWEKSVKDCVKKIMVIDDLANRCHDCDILLDQNLTKNYQSRYDDLVPAYCKKLLGPRYALLRPEFHQARPEARVRDKIQRILVFFGGVDLSNETAKAIMAIASLNKPDIISDVVVGKSNQRKEEIRALCSQYPNFNYYCQVNNMAELMLKADLAVGAGGATTWERCYLGLPAINIVIAKNQEEVSAALNEKGIINNLGCFSEVTVEMISSCINSFINDPNRLSAMSLKALELFAVRENFSFYSLFFSQCKNKRGGF